MVRWLVRQLNVQTDNKRSPPQAAGYSEQRQLTVLVQLLVAGALLLDIGADGALVAQPADGAGERAVAPELPTPKLFFTPGHHRKISRAVRLLMIVTSLVTL